VKLPHGEFVSPENLEIIFKNSPQIRQIYIHAVPLWPFLCGVIIPSDKMIHSMFPLSVPSQSQLQAILNRPQNIQLFKKELQKIGDQNRLRSWEIPLLLIINVEPFTEQNGLLTTTAKMCRRALAAKYSPQFDVLYENMKKNREEEEKASLQNESTVGKIRSLALSLLDQSHSFSTVEQTTTCREMGMDSLGVSRFAVLLRETYSIPIELTQFFDVAFLLSSSTSLQTIADRIDCLEKGIAAGETLQMIAEKIERTLSQTDNTNSTVVTTQMLNDLRQFSCADRSKYTSQHSLEVFCSPRHVLLTGATGFLGIHLLNEILCQTKAKVICLVRGKTDEEAQTRLSEIVKKSFIKCDSVSWERVTVLNGDVSLSMFGLLESKYKELVQSVDVIYHCGAFVNHVLPYEALRDANVIGVSNILQFCKDGSSGMCFKALHFISTVAAITRYEIK
jgi:fatty acid CoA ligase FadD9